MIGAAQKITTWPVAGTRQAITVIAIIITTANAAANAAAAVGTAGFPLTIGGALADTKTVAITRFTATAGLRNTGGPTTALLAAALALAGAGADQKLADGAI